MNASKIGLLLLACTVLAACSRPEAPASPPPATTQAPTPAPKALVAPIPKGKVISSTLVVGGQPTPEALAEMAKAGLKTVVNLKTPGEMTFDEAAEAERLGLTYVAIPMAGKAGLNAANVERLHGLLEAGDTTLVHCQGGNRVGALFALHAQRYEGASVEDAMAVGLAHGMTGLEGPVLELLTVNGEVSFVKAAAKQVGLFKAALGAELKAALKAGGPAHAIGVCAEKAPVIAQKMSDDTLTIRRVGTRVRNTKTNTPTAAMTAVMSGLTPDNPVHVGAVDGKQTAVHALFIQEPVCLSCHGAPGSLGAEVKAALAARYPDDGATGYQMGDLRGAIVVEKR
ncbi:MAG: DUF3365 domain-containing protein [Myxococcota bacterium]|nr:DUF3365 domain-containing protein [Myxococcota bacterium]